MKNKAVLTVTTLKILEELHAVISCKFVLFRTNDNR